MITIGDFLVYLNETDFPIITTNKREQFYNIPCSFDIETSSFYDGDEKRAIMYEWTFGICDQVTCGRTWDEFRVLMQAISVIMKLSQKRRLLCYVHNLPYEFQFIRKRLDWSKVFLLDDLKPVYAISTLGIEFRCSLKLSGKSLANTAKDLTHHTVEKMVGDLDYSLIRTPLTPLSEKELKYCENDVRVVLAYIAEKIEQDGDITRIPLTNTGYVRRYCRERCFPELAEDELVDELINSETIGVSRTERSLSRGFYPRECPRGWQDSDEYWLVRLHQLISGGDDS